MYALNPVVILEAAVRAYGEKVQVTPPLWINTQEEFVTVGITQYHGRSFNGRFYYKLGSFSNTKDNKAFTLVELLVVISIVILLAAMLLPAIRLVKDASLRASCSSNMRSLACATIAYSSESDGMLPLGGPFNGASIGNWASCPQVAAIPDYLDVTVSNNANTTKAIRCPANRTGMIYPFYAAQPSDHPATISRLIDCAHKHNIPGEQPVLWADACYLSDGGNGLNFVTACGHKGNSTGATSGIPKGGNVSFTDGSVAWAPMTANANTTDVNFIINGGSIGFTQAIPSCTIWIRMNASGLLDTSRTDNLVTGKIGLAYLGNF
jgi:prepilin-type processing-associated H-X9-DG protein